MTAPDVDADVRARFEAWMRSVGLGSLLDKTPARHDGSFEYISAGTQHRWLGYRAAHADLAGEVRELAQDVHDRFVWMQSPDTKGEHHKVKHESVMKALELADTLLAKFTQEKQ